MCTIAHYINYRLLITQNTFSYDGQSQTKLPLPRRTTVSLPFPPVPHHSRSFPPTFPLSPCHSPLFPTSFPTFPPHSLPFPPIFPPSHPPRQSSSASTLPFPIRAPRLSTVFSTQSRLSSFPAVSHSWIASLLGPSPVHWPRLHRSFMAMSRIGLHPLGDVLC